MSVTYFLSPTSILVLPILCPCAPVSVTYSLLPLWALQTHSQVVDFILFIYWKLQSFENICFIVGVCYKFRHVLFYVSVCAHFNKGDSIVFWWVVLIHHGFVELLRWHSGQANISLCHVELLRWHSGQANISSWVCFPAGLEMWRHNKPVCHGLVLADPVLHQYLASTHMTCLHETC